MRNVEILNDNGIFFTYQSDDNIDPKGQSLFDNCIFTRSGNIRYFPFLNILKEFYFNFNIDVYNRLNTIDDKFNIWIIFNQFTDNANPWNINKFLSMLFSTDVYAENVCLFVSEDELNNGYTEVTDEDNEQFKTLINQICECVTIDRNDYLDKLDIMLLSDNVIRLSNDHVKNFHNEYIGKKAETNFTELINLNNGETILRKNGVIMCVNIENTSAELYFTNPYKSQDDLNLFIECIC